MSLQRTKNPGGCGAGFVELLKGVRSDFRRRAGVRQQVRGTDGKDRRSLGTTAKSAGLALIVAAALLVPPGSLADVSPHGGHSHHHGGDLSPDYLSALQRDALAIEPSKSDPTGQKDSGGRAVVHRAGGRVVDSPRLEKRAPDARLYRTSATTFEPTLGIAKNGSMFFNAFTPNSDPAVIVSNDKGASWKQTFAGHPFTADPYLHVDQDTSRVFANDFALPCHYVSYSDDNGKSWTTGPAKACSIFDHQTLFTGPAPKGGDQPEGYRNVVYFCGITLGASIASLASGCSKSLDGGDTFVPTGQPAFVDEPPRRGDFGVPGHCNGANAHGFVGPDGTVYLPRGWCGQPWLAISKDEGQTWKRVQVADNGMPCCGDTGVGVEADIPSHESGVVADRRGNIYYTWVAADRLPYLAVSRDGGKSWSKPLMIGSPGSRETLLPGIAIGSAGKVAVVYMASKNSPWNGKKAKGSYDKTRWDAYITMTTNAKAKSPVFYSGQINRRSDPMWIGACGPDPIRCNWGDFFDVVIAPDGSPWAALVDLCKNRKCVDGSGEGVAGRLVGGPRLR